MTMSFDEDLTFDTFVVGPANRLASAAARRAAESPGSGYNPLFLYSDSGLGKSHILSAIAQQSKRANPGAVVRYETLEGYLEELTKALQKGGREEVRDRYRESDILLLDDVQFLTGQAEAQEMLLRTLDTLTSRGAQVVLASDRPPAEINDLDARLLSRFSGGLIVDIGQPDYETRVAIMRRKAEDRGAALAPGVAEAMGRYPFRNVRELQGALNRLLAIQELEERRVSADEVPKIMGETEAALPPAEEGARLSAPFTPIPEQPDAAETPAWKLAFREVAEAVDRAGFSPHRIRRHLDSGREPEDWRAVLAHFRADVDRLRELKAELDELGNPWPEAAVGLLGDPDRIEEAEGLLASARERARPFPTVGEGHPLEEIGSRFPQLAVRAVKAMVSGERPEYNPLYLHSPTEGRLQLFLEGTARSFRRDRPEARIALISVPEFAEEFIRAISDGVAGAWRERWWTVDLLLLRKVEGLAFTERAQEEFFHLFEALKQRGGRVILAGDRVPSRLDGVEDRLRTRFEGGLVVDLGSDPEVDRAATGSGEADGGKGAGAGGGREDADGEDVLEALRVFAGVPGTGRGRGDGPAGGDSPRTGSAGPGGGSSGPAAVGPPASGRPAGSGGSRSGASPADAGSSSRSAPPAAADSPIAEGGGRDDDEDWYPHPERVAWIWPHLDERIVEDEG